MILTWQLSEALAKLDPDFPVYILYDGKMVPLTVVAGHDAGTFLMDSDGVDYIDDLVRVQLLVSPGRGESVPEWPREEHDVSTPEPTPEDPPDRLETILWLDLPFADATDSNKLKAAVARVAADYCAQHGLTMIGTPLVTHQDQYGPMHDVMVRHRIRMYTEPYTSGYKLDSQTVLDGDFP